MNVSEQQPTPTPLIHKDHPLREIFEARRKALMTELAPLNRALGYGDGTAKERREQLRGWQGEEKQSA